MAKVNNKFKLFFFQWKNLTPVKREEWELRAQLQFSAKTSPVVTTLAFVDIKYWFVR